MRERRASGFSPDYDRALPRPSCSRRLFAFEMSSGYNMPHMISTKLISATVLMLLTAALPARAARVSGTLTGYDNSSPQPNRYLHFENRVTLDVYMAPTAADGSFATNLPPGTYRLREEHGAIIARGIAVGVVDLTLGNVSE